MTTTAPNTIFLRLEGVLQAWGDNSKFIIRRTMDAPTKSGVLGLICCAMGVRRHDAPAELKKLNDLQMGVRIDRPGTRWWDYHTVGAGYGILSAEGKPKKTASTGEYETLISRREYLCDASFLVALQGDENQIAEIRCQLENPAWTLYLGRKSCPPGVPVLARPGPGEEWSNPMRTESLLDALATPPWRPRFKSEAGSGSELLECIIEWRPFSQHETPPLDAEVWYDKPVSLDPPVHEARIVIRQPLEVTASKHPLLRHTPPPPRTRADYGNSKYKDKRKERLKQDAGLCVFCKMPATTVQHVTYRHVGSDKEGEDLRGLCRLCHDAITMIEYGAGMGLDRIDPVDVRWRDSIIRTREEIRRWRSEQTRKRALSKAPEDIRRELEESEA